MIYYNEEGGAGWRRQILAATGSHNMCVADFEGRGKLDIAGANWSGLYQPVELWRQLD
jgi:hypothetical protein